MYAIIRAGGKQAKVSSGDVIEVERVKDAGDSIEFKPILVVDDNGDAHSAADALSAATVTAKVLGETKGDKIDMFKYKNKTGYRRRQGHRQTFTQIEITGIDMGSGSKKTPKKPAAKKPAAKKPATKSAAEATPTDDAGSEEE